MPKLWRRDDGCYIIRGIIHNEDEDNCTWQVDHARNTINHLNKNGIDTNTLPATFPLKILVELKQLGWISTENQAGQKLKPPKPTKPKGSYKRKKKKDKSLIKAGASRKRSKKPKPKERSKPNVPILKHWSISAVELASELGVKTITIMNESGRRGFKVQSSTDRIPNSVAKRIREYLRWAKSKYQPR